MANIKIGDRVNGHIVNFVGSCFLEYGNGRRISIRNIHTIVPLEVHKANTNARINARVKKRYHEDEEYRKKVLESGKKYYYANEEKMREHRKKYWAENKERLTENHNKYVEEHREQINAYNRERRRKRKEMKNESN